MIRIYKKKKINGDMCVTLLNAQILIFNEVLFLIFYALILSLTLEMFFFSPNKLYLFLC